ncbi:MAG: hypothetical protein AB1545_08310 [Thermodesulfobacteriota bacterium]
MKGMIPEAKVNVKKRSIHWTAENAPAKVEVSRGAMFTLGAVPTLIGIWAAACFIGGLVSAGGTVELAYGWFKAIAGL